MTEHDTGKGQYSGAAYHAMTGHDNITEFLRHRCGHSAREGRFERRGAWTTATTTVLPLQPLEALHR